MNFEEFKYHDKLFQADEVLSLSHCQRWNELSFRIRSHSRVLFSG